MYVLTEEGRHGFMLLLFGIFFFAAAQIRFTADDYHQKVG